MKEEKSERNNFQKYNGKEEKGNMEASRLGELEEKYIKPIF